MGVVFELSGAGTGAAFAIVEHPIENYFAERAGPGDLGRRP
jgi:hypothetical protein